MNTLRFLLASTLVSLVACSSSTTTPNTSQNPPADETPSQTTHTALNFYGSCSASTCGEVPSSNTQAAPVCQPGQNGSCSWASDPNGTTSYRECQKSECPTTVPDASVCPAGLEFKGATCGSENDAACIWRAACTPPRSTTLCPDPNGCGDAMPDIGVICKDGSNGGLACYLLSTGKCGFQPTCE